MSKLTVHGAKAASPATAKSDIVVVPLFKNEDLSTSASEVNAAAGDVLQRAITIGDADAKLGKITTMVGSGNIARIMSVGCGDRASFNLEAQLAVTVAVSRALASSKAKNAIVVGDPIADDKDALAQFLEFLGRDMAMACYHYTATLGKPKPGPTFSKLTVAVDGISATKAKQSLSVGATIGNGANLTRELVNLPGNVCTPSYLAKEGRALGRKYDKLSVSVLDEKKMASMGMGSLLSVGNGSDEPSKLIVMKYEGGPAKQAPYCLVGKGITFDTGGISLKPAKGMESMKFDMGGAGSVFGVMQTVAELGLNINVIGVVAAAENMPSGCATKPGDVVTSMSGKTIEILNTDAEGRLVLCDALTYVERFKPEEVVDIATLTGAIIVSLGHEASGLFANDDGLAESLTAAGLASGDEAWRLPINKRYDRQLNSKYADMQNIGTGTAGSITAACFLARFAEKYKWAHLDVAGTAFQSMQKGATGRPVPLLVEYLRQKAS
ncbi:MAG: leucyl aminopeptidase [Pseudomonadota bacterium]|nr:leucyl aminopeptidase [Pseudomonadota bacterium]